MRKLFRVESLWILTRTPFPKPWIMKEARSVVESLGLRVSSLRGVQQDCHIPGRLRLYQQALKRKHFQDRLSPFTPTTTL